MNTKTLLLLSILILGLGGVWLFLLFNETPNQTATEPAALPVNDETVEPEPAIPTEPELEPVDGEVSTIPDDAIMEFPVTDNEVPAKVFNLVGENFAFDIEEIRVKEGDTVIINLESTDGFHDWVVDKFDAATAQVGPGTPTTVTFTATEAGTYEYYCSVGSHRARGMVGVLVVE